MTTPRGTQPMPRCILDFRIAVEGFTAPVDVLKVMEAVAVATHNKHPIVALNRALGQLRRQHPEIFWSLGRWLGSPEIQTAAIISGAHQSWLRWCVACEALLRGETASVAFGLNTPGTPPSHGFTAYEDAAILAEFRSHFVRSETATTSVLEMPNGVILDRREVQRHRATVRLIASTITELAEPAELVRSKYRKR